MGEAILCGTRSYTFESIKASISHFNFPTNDNELVGLEI